MPEDAFDGLLPEDLDLLYDAYCREIDHCREYIMRFVASEQDRQEYFTAYSKTPKERFEHRVLKIRRESPEKFRAIVNSVLTVPRARAA